MRLGGNARSGQVECREWKPHAPCKAKSKKTSTTLKTESFFIYYDNILNEKLSCIVCKTMKQFF